MGGSFSEPAALLDLGTDVSAFYRQPKIQKQVGWHVPGFSPQQLIAGMQHVDDAFLASGVFCEHCLYEGTKRLWPKNVGTTLEESGSKIKFMATTIVFFPDNTFETYPTPVNLPFARGLADFPEISRLSKFLGFEIHTYNYFRQFLLGRIVNINLLSMGYLARSIFATAALFGEVYRLDWPRDWVVGVSISLPRHHFSQYTRAVVELARSVRATKQPITFHFVFKTLTKVARCSYLGSSPISSCVNTLLAHFEHELGMVE